MSYCFCVEAVGIPTYADVLAGLEDLDLRCQTGTVLSGEWRVGHVHRLFVYGMSTRSIEAVLQDRAFRVTLFSGACQEDYELALHIVSAVSRRFERPIVSEEGVRFAPEERRRGYGRGWVDDHIRTIAKVMLRMAASKRPDDPVVIEGPIRPFYLGPRIAHAILEEGQTDLDRAERLIERIRRLQYLTVPFAEVEATRLPDSERLVACSVLRSGSTAVYQRVDVIAVDAAAPVYVPWEQVETLLGPYLYWLDEWTVLARAVPASAWPGIVSRAEQLEASDGEVSSDLTQDTWWSTQITDAPTEPFEAPTPRVADAPEDDGEGRRWWDLWRKRR